MLNNILRTKVFIFLLIGLSLALLISSVILFSKKNALNQQLEQAKQMFLKVNEEKQRIETEKEKITKENEKLKADTLVYIELNNDLQKEKENLQNRLKEAQKIIETKEDGLERLKLNLEKLNKKIAKESSRQNEELMKQKKEVEDKISYLETTLQKERALYHYNLAVSYTKAKLYDEAIKVFEKSLIFDPNMAEAHYNLGLLYGDVEEDYQKAVFHYRRYLELIPNASDKEGVEAEIKKLIQKSQ